MFSRLTGKELRTASSTENKILEVAECMKKVISLNIFLFYIHIKIAVLSFDGLHVYMGIVN